MKTVPDYDQDGLRSIHNNEFMVDKEFVASYERGVKAAGTDYQWHWRVHVGLWAARHCSHLDGDYVECGVNAGFLSSAIMHHLDWDGTGKQFYLLDTFSGIDPEYVSDDERLDGILDKNRELLEKGFYIQDVAAIRKNFAEWKNCQIIEGTIPDTLTEIKSESVAFLHIDMNCAPPEVAAIKFLWPKMTTGGIVLLDDYAYAGYHHQKKAMDDFCKSQGVEILSLPTGQGLLIKPGEVATIQSQCRAGGKVKTFISRWFDKA